MKRRFNTASKIPIHIRLDVYQAKKTCIFKTKFESCTSRKDLILPRGYELFFDSKRYFSDHQDSVQLKALLAQKIEKAQKVDVYL